MSGKRWFAVTLAVAGMLVAVILLFQPVMATTANPDQGSIGAVGAIVETRCSSNALGRDYGSPGETSACERAATRRQITAGAIAGGAFLIALAMFVTGGAERRRPAVKTPA